MHVPGCEAVAGERMVPGDNHVPGCEVWSWEKVGAFRSYPPCVVVGQGARLSTSPDQSVRPAPTSYNLLASLNTVNAFRWGIVQRYLDLAGSCICSTWVVFRNSVPLRL
jgi:hypothetical protein